MKIFSTGRLGKIKECISVFVVVLECTFNTFKIVINKSVYLKSITKSQWINKNSVNLYKSSKMFHL